MYRCIDVTTQFSISDAHCISSTSLSFYQLQIIVNGNCSLCGYLTNWLWLDVCHCYSFTMRVGHTLYRSWKEISPLWRTIYMLNNNSILNAPKEWCLFKLIEITVIIVRAIQKLPAGFDNHKVLLIEHVTRLLKGLKDHYAKKLCKQYTSLIFVWENPHLQKIQNSISQLFKNSPITTPI